jgi:hypothetical protein
MDTPTQTLDSKALGAPLAAGGTAEIFAMDTRRVLKLYWRGASPGAPEREAERARAAHAAGAPSPAVLDILSADDRFGVVFECVQGPSMLQAMAADPSNAESLIRSLADLHAQLHGLSGTGLPPQREHLSRRIALSPLNHRLRATVLSVLSRLPDGDALCHGDFHPRNVLLAPLELRSSTGSTRCAATRPRTSLAPYCCCNMPERPATPRSRARAAT